MADVPEVIGPVDRRIGGCIRARRELLGLSVDVLAARLGLSPAAIDDLEAGRARAGAATLMLLTQALGVEVGYFLRSLVEEAPPTLPGLSGRNGDAPCP